MDPTNLLLIMALGSPHCQTRHIAQHHLEKQGMKAMVTLSTFEHSKDPEVANSCRIIKERITGKYILAWAENQKFIAMGKGKLENEWDQHYFTLAESTLRPDYAQSCHNIHRHATRLWAIDLLLSGEPWGKISNMIGDDGLPDEHYYEEP